MMSTVLTAYEKQCAKRAQNKKIKHSPACAGDDAKARIADIKEKCLKLLTDDKTKAREYANDYYKSEQDGTVAKEQFNKYQADYRKYNVLAVSADVKQYATSYNACTDTDTNLSHNLLTAGFVVAASSDGCIDMFMNAIHKDKTDTERTKLQFTHKMQNPAVDIPEHLGIQFVEEFEAMTYAASQMLRHKIGLWKADKIIGQLDSMMAEAEKYQQPAPQSVMDTVDVVEDTMSFSFQKLAFTRESKQVYNPVYNADDDL